MCTLVAICRPESYENKHMDAFNMLSGIAYEEVLVFGIDCSYGFQLVQLVDTTGQHYALQTQIG